MSKTSRFWIVMSMLLGAFVLCNLGGGGCGTAPSDPPAIPQRPAPAAPVDRSIQWKGLDTDYRGTTEIDHAGKVRQQR